MAEERCGLCKDAGQPNVLAAYRGTTAGQSGTGKAKPPMCYAHRNGLKPTWMAPEVWAKEHPLTPLRKHDVVAGSSVGKRVEDALQAADMAAKPEVKIRQITVPPDYEIDSQEKVQEVIEQDDMDNRFAEHPEPVPCQSQASLDCHKFVAHDKPRKICSPCWALRLKGGQEKHEREKAAGFRTSVRVPQAPTAVPFVIPDDVMYELLLQTWEVMEDRIMAKVLTDHFGDLPRDVQVKLVQAALTERKSRLTKPDSPTNGSTDWTRPQNKEDHRVEQDVNPITHEANPRTEEEIEEMRKGYASMH